MICLSVVERFIALDALCFGPHSIPPRPYCDLLLRQIAMLILQPRFGSVSDSPHETGAFDRRQAATMEVLLRLDRAIITIDLDRIDRDQTGQLCTLQPMPTRDQCPRLRGLRSIGPDVDGCPLCVGGHQLAQRGGFVRPEDADAVADRDILDGDLQDIFDLRDLCCGGHV